MTEKEKRQKVVDRAAALVGRKEADGSHREIIDAYNRIRPLPRGYRMSYDDPWCAAFVSAVGELCGMSEVILPECGCDAMIAKYKAVGRYNGPDYEAQPGDLIFYNWDGDMSVDHVGLVVERISGGYRIIEGNMSDAVGYRSVPAGWPLIAGFAAPDYGSGEVRQTEAEGAEESIEEIESKGEPIEEELPVLARGSKGLTVVAMQGMLIARGFFCGPDGADGDFGRNTEAALRRFQGHVRIDSDGVCGKKTWRKLHGLD